MGNIPYSSLFLERGAWASCSTVHAPRKRLDGRLECVFPRAAILDFGMGS